MIYATFVITFFLFTFVIQIVKPEEKPISPVIVGAFAFAALAYVPIGTTLRNKFLDGADESLRKNPQGCARSALVAGREYPFLHHC